MKKKSILTIFLILIITIIVARAARQPLTGENPYDLNSYLNVLLSLNGTLNNGINGSSVFWNVTNTLIAFNINASNGNFSQNLIVLGNINSTSINTTTIQALNYIGLPAFSNFQLSNVSNNTLTKDNNATDALLNITSNGNYVTRSSSSNITGLVTQFLNNFNLSNATFPSSSFTCGGTDKISSVTFNSNGTLLVTCATDQTSAGGDSSNMQLSNITDYLGGVGSNDSLLRNTNISGFPFSNFQLSNVSNDTLRISGNTSIALWNVSLTTNLSYIYTSYNYNVLIGALNLSNITERLVVIGNVNVSGYINASGDIKTAGSFYQGGNSVQLSKDFNIGNISNTTSWSNIINIPAFSNFQLSNVSNDTLGKSTNLSNSLFNRSSTNIFFKFFTDLFGIGTITPQATLHLNDSYVGGSLLVTNTSGTPIFFTNASSGNSYFSNYQINLTQAGSIYALNYFGNGASLTSMTTNATIQFANIGGYADAFKISNGTALPFSNFQLSNVSNTTTWLNIIGIPSTLPTVWSITNVSNVTSWSNIINIPAFSNFQLSNVSNDTLGKNTNITDSLFNVSGNQIVQRELNNVLTIPQLNFSKNSNQINISAVGNLSISIQDLGLVLQINVTGTSFCTSIIGSSGGRLSAC